MRPIIENRHDLAQLAAHLASASTIALDTEFLRERTYRANLCLLQIGDAHGPVCIDPIAIEDLSALAAPLCAAKPLKVMHASRQDVEVLLPAVGLVRPVFDTQIAAALAGFAAQIGYGELVRRLLGVELTKAHTRTDWSRRPLSTQQIDYALDDVRYLPALAEQLTGELERLGRARWLEEELAALADPTAYSVEPERAWLRVKGLQGLDAARTRLARELAAWRELRAMERNRPRGWILDDAGLREIVLAAPRSAQALAAIASLPAAVVEHCAEDILERIHAAELPEVLQPLETRMRPDPQRTALVKKLSAVLRAAAADLALSPEVLATRRDLELIAAGQIDVPPLGGWRRAVIGERLLAAL